MPMPIVMSEKVMVIVQEGNGVSQGRYTRRCNNHIARINKSSIIFFQNVVQFERIIASPKQPQSVTGFSIAIHNVSGVIANINSVESQSPNLELMFVISNAPAKNSAVIRANEATKANSLNQAKPITSR